MVQAIINISDRTNQILNIVKAKYGLKDKSQAIEIMTSEYEENLLEPELKPEFVEKLTRKQKEKTIKIVNFKKHYTWGEILFELQVRESTDDTIRKSVKKNKKLLEILDKKINEIKMKPYKFKPLRVPMQGYWRVHIAGSFVLTYSIDEKNKIVILEDFDHHDNVYK